MNGAGCLDTPAKRPGEFARAGGAGYGGHLHQIFARSALLRRGLARRWCQGRLAKRPSSLGKLWGTCVTCLDGSSRSDLPPKRRKQRGRRVEPARGRATGLQGGEIGGACHRAAHADGSAINAGVAKQRGRARR